MDKFENRWLEKYFGDSQARILWEGLHPKLQSWVNMDIAMMNQVGPLNEDDIARITHALGLLRSGGSDGAWQKLLEKASDKHFARVRPDIWLKNRAKSASNNWRKLHGIPLRRNVVNRRFKEAREQGRPHRKKKSLHGERIRGR